MSRTNKHRHNHILGLSLIYMHEILGPRQNCPRRSCSGTMAEVWTRYEVGGPINRELECTLCGKVIKDPKYKKEREKKWKQRQQNRKDRKFKGKRKG